MNTTRKKIAGGVLGLCLLALLLDRTVLAPGPAPAGAAPVPSAAAPAAAGEAATAAPADAEASASVHDRFGRRLRRLAEEKGWSSRVERDAFVPAASWPGLTREQQAEVARHSPGLSPADAFSAGHELNAVMAGSQGGYAIINGSMVLVGQEVDGFTLVRVSGRAAFLERAGVSVTLKVRSPEESGP